MAFPTVAQLFPAGSLAPATAKTYFQNWLTAILAILGDGSSSANARTALGLGTMATQAASAVAITGGSVLATTTIGYATGAGGTVTQATDKSTAVTLNKASGKVTMNAAALTAGAAVAFTFNNSLFAAGDVLAIHQNFSSVNYTLRVYTMQAGSASIYLRNDSAGSLSEAVAFNFVLIKGVTA